MAELKETLENAKATIKDTTQKILDSETTNKVKSAVEETTQKIGENENVAKVMDKVNKSKYATFIKVGAVVLAVILVFNIFGGGKGAKAEKFLKQYVAEEDLGLGAKITSSKVVAKNKDANLYLIDAKTKYTKTGEKFKTYYVVLLDGENSDVVFEADYDSETKSITKERALSYLVRG